MELLAPSPRSATGTQSAMPDLAGGLCYLARQPIMDLRGRVHGYELLFRAGPEPSFRGDGDMATRTMLDNTVLFGLEKLAGGMPAFVNCTRESLIENMVHVLPSSMTVLEILENIEPTPAVIDACRKLKAAGFRLALDDFTWKPDVDPLVELADYIKVDFVLSRPGGAAEAARAAARHPGRAGGGEDRDAGGVPAGLQRGLHALSGVLFLPPGADREPQDSRQPALPHRNPATAAARRDRPAQADRAAEAQHLAHLPAAAAGQLAAVRDAAGGPLDQGGAAWWWARRPSAASPCWPSPAN